MYIYLSYVCLDHGQKRRFPDQKVILSQLGLIRNLFVSIGSKFHRWTPK